MSKNIVIAIDGYSSCGKSTLAKALAKKLNFIYIDSGAMYRAVTLYFLRNAVNVQNLELVKEALNNIHLDFKTINNQTLISLNGEDVSTEIRQMHVAEKVSSISAIKEVRLEMVRQQQRMGKSGNIVMDGRDIGTVVFPDADLKLFMTADPQIRAQRRYTELKLSGAEVTLDEVFQNLNKRDEIDSNRKDSPLTFHSGYRLLDNSHISPKEQLEIAQIWVMEILNSESKY
jgi:cytidylate kinase